MRLVIIIPNSPISCLGVKLAVARMVTPAQGLVACLRNVTPWVQLLPYTQVQYQCKYNLIIQSNR